MRFELKTSAREQFVDITAEVARAVEASGVRDGVAVVSTEHTTAAVTVNENADPAVADDLLAGLSRIAPRQAGYRHAEGNSDAHLKSSLLGMSVTVPVSGGRLALGTWQAIYFCEFDGPRTRRVRVTALGE